MYSSIKLISILIQLAMALSLFSCSNVVYHWNWNDDKIEDFDWSKGTCIIARPKLPQGVELNSQLKDAIIKESKLIWNDSVIYLDSVNSWNDVNKDIEAKYLLQLIAKGSWADSGGFGYGNTTFPTEGNEVYLNTSVIDYATGKRIYLSIIRVDDGHMDLDTSTENGKWYITKSADVVIKKGFIKGIRNLKRKVERQ